MRQKGWSALHSFDFSPKLTQITNTLGSPLRRGDHEMTEKELAKGAAYRLAILRHAD